MAPPRRDTAQLIENLTFYTFGRTERDIETLADRLGVHKSEFATRLSNLFSNVESGPTLGNAREMPTVPEDAGRRRLPAPQVEVDDRTRPDMHRPSNREKHKTVMTLVVATMSRLQPPVDKRALYDSLRAAGLKNSQVHAAVHVCRKKKLIRKVGDDLSWDQTKLQALAVRQNGNSNSNGHGNEGEGSAVAPARTGVSLKSAVLRSLAHREGPVGQRELIHSLAKTTRAAQRFNGCITSMVRSGQITRDESGKLFLPK